ncbi:MAG: hypothetical protein K940chlam8_01135 [Chlamydiae bacterium]|nr:hypothetical protein [Chlamydiota bacterium]
MKKSKFNSTHFLEIIESYKKIDIFSNVQYENTKELILSIAKTLEDYQDIEHYNALFLTFLKEIKAQTQNPYVFEPFHKQTRSPYDYMQFGIDFLAPFIDIDHSTCMGQEHLETIEAQLKSGHNVILFSNHQSEGDPQMLFSIFRKLHKEYLSEKIIFVAGERVTQDPFAIPFSLGCNLICIYSKNYTTTPKEKSLEKLEHNKKVMHATSELLKQGGQLIWVAPSGGRDRKEKDVFQVAPFDKNAIEMFYLLAKKAVTPTHFYPLSLLTYAILPPPEERQKELGEKRPIYKGCIHSYFGKEIDMESFHDKEKKRLRKKRTDFIFREVKQNYQTLLKQHKGHQ